MVMADSAKNCFLRMEAMFGRFRPEKGQILLRKHQEITRKFGRNTAKFVNVIIRWLMATLGAYYLLADLS